MHTKVIVASDHQLFRKGLISLLQNSNAVNITAEASACEEIPGLSTKLQCDVLLLDLNMLNPGFEILEALKKNSPRTKTLTISPIEDDNLIGYAMEKGAAGYISKNADSQEMVQAIQSVANTGFYLNEKTSRIIYKRLSSKKHTDTSSRGIKVKFSEKEIDVIKLLGQELSNAEIGKRIFLSHRTVETIRQQMIRKAGVRNALGLVLYAAKNGLIEI